MNGVGVRGHADPSLVPSERQAAVTRRYDRMARFYDVMNGPMERGGVLERRRRIVGRAQGRTLEVGVGTGRNLPLYTPGVELVATDVSPRMLERARQRAATLTIPVTLELADAQRLPYADASFDTVVATCVFCSVPDPVRGLGELKRVVRPEGRVLLVEHVRPTNAVLGMLADAASVLTTRLVGPAMNRRTEDNVRAAGLEILEVRADGIWREIVARPQALPRTGSAGGAPTPATGERTSRFALTRRSRASQLAAPSSRESSEAFPSPTEDLGVGQEGGRGL